MNLRAITFVLSDLETGRGLGLALICPEVRYASIVWRAADRLDRRFVPLQDWPLLELALNDPLPPTPLESGHPIVRILLPAELRRSTIVQYLAIRPLEVARPGGMAQQLDAELRRMLNTSAT